MQFPHHHLNRDVYSDQKKKKKHHLSSPPLYKMGAVFFSCHMMDWAELIIRRDNTAESTYLTGWISG